MYRGHNVNRLHNARFTFAGRERLHDTACIRRRPVTLEKPGQLRPRPQRWERLPTIALGEGNSVGDKQHTDRIGGT